MGQSPTGITAFLLVEGLAPPQIARLKDISPDSEVPGFPVNTLIAPFPTASGAIMASEECFELNGNIRAVVTVLEVSSNDEEVLLRTQSMLSVTPTGTLLICSATRSIIGEAFQSRRFVPLARTQLSGFPVPEVLYKVQTRWSDSGKATRGHPLATNNLPSFGTRFVGRKAEIEQLSIRFYLSRAVAIVGPAGMGKSRIAAEFGNELLDRQPDGVWFFRVDRIGQTDLASAIIGRIGYRADMKLPALERLANLFATREQTLILDACESRLSDVVPLVSELIRGCPNLQILLTSRDPIALSSVSNFRLGPMSVSGVTSDAADLFSERLLVQSPDFDPDYEEVVEICDQLGGIPAAIEAAAAAYGNSQLARHAFTRGRPGLKETFKSLLGGLSEEQTEALRACAAFSGSITSEAHAQVFEAKISLDSLAAMGILTHALDDRYYLSAGLREYIFAKSKKRNGRFRDNHARHFAESSSRFAQKLSETGATEDYEANLDDLYGALGWANVRGLNEQIFTLCDSLYDFWMHCGWYEEGAAWLRQSAECVIDNSEFAARLNNMAASMLILVQQFDLANEHLRIALSLTMDSNLESVKARIYNNFGLSAWFSGELNKALSAFEETIALADKLGETLGAQFARCNAAGICVETGQFADAQHFLCSLGRDTSPLIRGYERMTWGIYSLVQQEFDSAEGALLESFDILLSIGHLRGLVFTCRCLVPTYAGVKLHTQAAYLCGFHDRLNEENYCLSSMFYTNLFDEARDEVELALGEGTFNEIYDKGYYAKIEDVQAYMSKKLDRS